MIRGFTFERALSWPFTAPHAATFPWVFGLCYALVSISVFGAVGLLAVGDIAAWVNTVEAIEGSTDPDASLEAFFGGFVRLLPWAGLLGLASWMIWAMFETASQRRYIFGRSFSLGFGADELRMMVVGLLWNLLGFVLLAVPFLLITGSAFAAIFAGQAGLSDNEVAERIVGPLVAALGLMVLIFPLYVFFATRLAPCFGLTVRQKKIRFLDAWNVSRGRFWPILGAYFILAFTGAILGQVITGIAQVLIAPSMLQIASAGERGADVAGLLLSPAFLLPLAVYVFIVLFVQGILQHAVGGPAAFAVRHDPRGGVDEEVQIQSFD